MFPEGTATYDGLILGFPSLDVQPYGMGWRIHKTTFTFDLLGNISLPRFDADKRQALKDLKDYPPDADDAISKASC